MQHRHLNHQNLTLAAIDDVIGRGQRQDWTALRRAVADDRQLLEKILRVCCTHLHYPYAQRHHLWSLYAKQRLA